MGIVNVHLVYDKQILYLEHIYDCFRGWEDVAGAAEEI